MAIRYSYATSVAREETVNEKGFFILPSQLFANVRAKARHDTDLNETLSWVFRSIEGSAVGAASEDDFKGLFDDLDVLGDVCRVRTGAAVSRVTIGQSPGPYPVINSGREPLGYINSYNTEDDPIGITSRGAGVGSVTWRAGRYFRGNLNYSATILDRSRIDTRFLYHSLLFLQPRIQQLCTYQGIPALNKVNLEKLTVPVPPLEVQLEIVRVLDTFAALEADLEAELEAELEARRRQYGHSRTKILTPDSGWRWTTLGAISEISDGPHDTPKKTSSGPWYLSISSLKDGNVDLAASAHLSAGDYPKWTRRVAPRLGDTLFSYETRIGQAAFWNRTDPAALGRRMGLLRPRESEVVPKFLTIAYLSPGFQALIESKTVRGSTVDRIPIADISNWPISIPSIAEQKRIIALLDSFDALVNDISVGLLAELAARRKQYEHYRDRLLTFPEAS